MSVKFVVCYPSLNNSTEELIVPVRESVDEQTLLSSIRTSLERHRLASYILCELKRRIQASKQIPALYQELSFGETAEHNENIDLYLTSSFNDSNPLQVRCARRERRIENNSLKVESWNGISYLVYVDKECDTVIDLKFQLASLLNTRPEYLQLLTQFKHRLMNNLQHLGRAQILTNKHSDMRIIYWLEIPSISTETGNAGNKTGNTTAENTFVVRSAPQLMNLNPVGSSTNNPLMNIGSMFRHFCAEFANNRFLGTRTFTTTPNENGNTRGEFEWMSYGEANQMTTYIASAFVGLLGLQPGKAKLGLCSANRREWVLCDYAGHTQSFITVPLYDTLAVNAIEYIVNHAEIEAIVCSKEVVAQVHRVRDRCPTLKYVILMDLEAPDQVWLRSKENQKGMYTHRLSELIEYGRALSQPIEDHCPTSPDQIATICYTSGTTGDPKGVVTTHGNLLTSCVGIVTKLTFFDSNSCILSYLPLAHIYEKAMELLVLMNGARCGYWSGDVLTLVDDLQVLKPTLFVGVPRVYQKFQDRVSAQIESSSYIKKSLLNRACAAKKWSLENKQPVSALWDKLVFSKIRAKFGGNIKACVSGSAPLSSSTAEFLKLFFAEILLEGYGLTETSAAGSVTHEEDQELGQVGQMPDSVEMKLMDVPDMNYLTSDEPHPRGEIWLRGPTIFQGYYKNAKKTKQVLTEDGWFATGDVGMWRVDARLQIIDRKKNIFKLAQGEYIRPDYIENVYKLSQFVANIFVDGNSNETYLVAIVVPDYEVLVPYVKSKLSLPDVVLNDKKKLIGNSEVRLLIIRDMERVAKREQLNGFEKVKRLSLVEDDFTIESGLLTATMKLKRNVARVTFKQLIQNMYEQVAPAKL